MYLRFPFDETIRARFFTNPEICRRGGLIFGVSSLLKFSGYVPGGVHRRPARRNFVVRNFGNAFWTNSYRFSVARRSFYERHNNEGAATDGCRNSAFLRYRHGRNAHETRYDLAHINVKLGWSRKTGCRHVTRNGRGFGFSTKFAATSGCCLGRFRESRSARNTAVGTKVRVHGYWRTGGRGNRKIPKLASPDRITSRRECDAGRGW